MTSSCHVALLLALALLCPVPAAAFADFIGLFPQAIQDIYNDDMSSADKATFLGLVTAAATKTLSHEKMIEGLTSLGTKYPQLLEEMLKPEFADRARKLKSQAG